MTVPVTPKICPHCGTYLWPRPMQLSDILPLDEKVWGRWLSSRPMVEWFLEPWSMGWHE